MKVFKWDDDLAVELPKELVDQLALKEGDELDISAAPAVGAEVGTKETPDTWTK
ncbi:AbrB/MazE/SpoVT family DNA-binding domain-containing protein [Bradyrhizobium manausense]|nr:AbrB/MazE/SpoVT family DNA-binding domain-containing protein [Bradyrhizobium manausense]